MKTVWHYSGKYLIFLFVWFFFTTFGAVVCPSCRWTNTYVAEAELIITGKIISVEAGKEGVPFDTIVLQVQDIIKGECTTPQLKVVTFPKEAEVGTNSDWLLTRYQENIYFALPFCLCPGAGYRRALKTHRSYTEWGEDYQTWKIWMRRDQASVVDEAELLVKLARDKDPFVRGKVAANPATPAKILSALARDEDWWVPYHLADNEQAPIPILIYLATTNNYSEPNNYAETEWIALGTLIKIENQHQSVGPAVMTLLDQPEKQIRHEALMVFNSMTSDLKSISSDLLFSKLMELWEQEAQGGRIDAKTRADIEYRRSIIEALGNLGPKSASAANWLVRLAEDSTLQETIVFVLGKIEANEAIPLLTAIIQRPIEYIKTEDNESLGEVEELGQNYFLDIPEDDESFGGVEELGEIAEVTEQTDQTEEPEELEDFGELEELEDLEEQTESTEEAASNVEQTEKITEETILRERHLKKQRRLRRIAIYSLGKIGPPAASELPILLHLLDREKLDDDTHAIVLTAISQIAPQDSRIAPALIAALRTTGWKNYRTRRAAIEAWKRLGENTTAAAGLLENFQKESNEKIRKNMLQALKYIGSHNGVEAAIVQTAESSTTLRIRREAIYSMGKLPPTPKVMVTLIAALEDQNVQLAACNALRQLGPPAKEALPALRMLLQHESAKIRKAVKLAIIAIEK